MATSEIDDYLSRLDPDERATLEQLRRDVLALVPGAQQGMAYGVPAFRVAGKVVAGFSAAKGHLSYLPHSGSVLASMSGEDLAGYTWSKGALKFKAGQPLPRALVAKLVALRRAQIAG